MKKFFFARSAALVFLAALGVGHSHAASASAKTSATPDSSPFVFSLVPRALQKNPRVEFNIISEMTAEGRKAPHASPSAPIYYLSKSGGFVHLGQGATAKDKSPTFERMEKVLEQALANSGYLQAGTTHTPSIVIIYSWGAHSSPADDPDSDAPAVSNKAMIDDMIERARLVGGEKFAAGLIQAMSEEGALKSATTPVIAAPADADPPVAATAPFTDAFGPIERFRNASDKNRGLMEDLTHSIYFVVASAYDAKSVATKSKILLWRTKMSVNAAGISLTETVPALAAAGAAYFGRDMSEPAVLSQRLNREGNVEIGTATVIDYGADPKSNAPAESTPLPPPAAKKR